tara:strand:- start:432 stop:587 length:156 start_codon:yes stop_codon:yes gene_type:complete
MTYYKILRFYQKDGKQTRIIKRGLSLEEAKEHCHRDDTHGTGWFDGWTVDE